MTYLMSFIALRRRLEEAGAGPDEGGLDGQVVEAIRSLLRAVPVDETWYRQVYPDVEEAIGRGDYLSARHHFVEHGYFEGRRPADLPVDETWYVNHYPDVVGGIDNGDIESGQEHYNRHGYAEGRLPALL